MHYENSSNNNVNHTQHPYTFRIQFINFFSDFFPFSSLFTLTFDIPYCQCFWSFFRENTYFQSKIKCQLDRAFRTPQANKPVLKRTFRTYVPKNGLKWWSLWKILFEEWFWGVLWFYVLSKQAITQTEHLTDLSYYSEQELQTNQYHTSIISIVVWNNFPL